MAVAIKGLVVPAQWDNNGNVMGIALATYDEREFLVLMDEVGRSMIDLLHKKVVITGECIKMNNTDLIKVVTINKNSM